MKIRISLDIKVGRLVKYFILSDLTLLAGWGLIEPVFSIFIIQNIAGATLITVGASAAIYWLLKSLLQLPLANYLDKTPGEKDDFYALIFGLLLAAFSAISFALVKEIWQLYLVQIIHAIGFALYAASWPAIFSRHLDKDRISFDWALDSTAAGVSAGVSGFVGGIIANSWGFPAVFIFAGIFSALSAVLLIMAPDLILPKQTTPLATVIPKDGPSAKLSVPLDKNR
ncbi:MAG: MFS transporter [Patescibacteria group bacterium]|nr:MFS transporter [Patescibacteria group bacterium]MDE2015116.1 MFS transporter [Patescibacteria group bacterium]MDE2226544.1 MFS transporter [Patescibacteria group bacterium]